MAILNALVERIVDRWRRHRELRFLVVGGWNTAFGYFAFLVLYALLHERIHYLIIGLLAHGVAMVNAFACQRLLVFQSSGPVLAQFVRFNVAQLFVLALGLASLWMLVSVLHLHPLFGQAIVTIGSVVVSYVAHRRFSFAQASNG